MTIAALADPLLKDEWLQKAQSPDVEIRWCGSVKTLVATVADVYVDLLFTADNERTKHLMMRSTSPFFINAVESTTKDAGSAFIRINAWPGFLKRDTVEVAVPGPQHEATVSTIFTKLNWKYQLVPDIPGMITPRIIATIINEAYFTFGDGISTKDEIDIAMKLGTSYPYGPFEWAEKIGLNKIHALLIAMAKLDKRYEIAPALETAIRQQTIQ
ncbi:MAG: hypothetical protein H7Y31_17695 [Chitinophagaceae bacterium]|nr:hypothetical protein [Chitinophagaceae bacterium]